MEASNTDLHQLQKYVKDITLCPICLDTCVDPRSPSCLHAFCFKCIKKYCEDKCSGDEVVCPVCRKEFQIPDDGLESMQRNFFVSGLIAAKSSSDADQVRVEVRRITIADVVVICECCGEETGKEATAYCENCREQLCDSCVMRCRKRKGEAHTVVKLGEESDYVRIPRGSFCEEHCDELLKLYCMECQVIICTVCFAVKHRQHECQEIDKVAVEFRAVIQDRVQPLTATRKFIKTEAETIARENREFVAKANKVQMLIKKNGDELKQLVDERVQELLQEAQHLRLETQKDIEARADKLEFTLVAVDSCVKYAEELDDKGTPCDIARSANDL